jgi:hypothetical protein
VTGSHRDAHEAGAIGECDEHGWAKDLTDPHANAPSTSLPMIRLAARHQPDCRCE